MHTTPRDASPNRIRELRETRGLLRVDIAHALRVTENTVMRWERGGAIPDVRKEVLARMLDAPIAYMMGWDEEAA